MSAPNDDSRDPARPRGATGDRKRPGRPIPGEEAVGRDALLEIARGMLRTTPPERVTRLAVAKAANVDPNLIRYYFGTVDHLISEVVVDNHRQIHAAMADLLRRQESLDWFKARIAHLVDLLLDNPHHHRSIQEVMYKHPGSVEWNEWKRALRESVAYTDAQLKLGVSQGTMRPVDPRMLHLVLVGIGEIFGPNPAIVADIYEGQETVASLRDRYVEFIYDLLYNGLKA